MYILNILSDPDNPILHNLPDLSQLSGEHKIDVPFPYFSEVLVFFTPLSVLEHLCDPSIEWGSEEHRRRLEQQSLPPLRLANNYEVSENDVQHVAMFDNDGEAWMAVVTKQHYIAFFHCGHSDVIVLKCTEHPEFALQVSVFISSSILPFNSRPTANPSNPPPPKTKTNPCCPPVYDH